MLLNGNALRKNNEWMVIVALPPLVLGLAQLVRT